MRNTHFAIFSNVDFDGFFEGIHGSGCLFCRHSADKPDCVGKSGPTPEAARRLKCRMG
jgi:hypothetical protein